MCLVPLNFPFFCRLGPTAISGESSASCERNKTGSHCAQSGFTRGQSARWTQWPCGGWGADGEKRVGSRTEASILPQTCTLLRNSGGHAACSGTCSGTSALRSLTRSALKSRETSSPARPVLYGAARRPFQLLLPAFPSRVLQAARFSRSPAGRLDSDSIPPLV